MTLVRQVLGGRPPMGCPSVKAMSINVPPRAQVRESFSVCASHCASAQGATVIARSGPRLNRGGRRWKRRAADRRRCGGLRRPGHHRQEHAVSVEPHRARHCDGRAGISTIGSRAGTSRGTCRRRRQHRHPRQLYRRGHSAFTLMGRLVRVTSSSHRCLPHRRSSLFIISRTICDSDLSCHPTLLCSCADRRRPLLPGHAGCDLARVRCEGNRAAG
jgi:hypothetical protein